MTDPDPSVRKESSFAAKALLVFGLLILAIGIFGVWVQGPFYGSWDSILPQDLEAAFVLPVTTVVTGCLMLAPVILRSSMTDGWTGKRRAAVYLAFVVTVLALCTIAGKIAAGMVGKTSSL